jgi:2-polyprenyl-6-hydroxyphenyl methylase/3-demethylubiquinone-9 3-methyltransferase
MPLGPFVRRLLGPLEKPISIAYRSVFIDLGALVERIRCWLPDSEVSRILEVGCGEGMLIEILAKAYPLARIAGIDITPRIGRLFKSGSDRVTFRRQTIAEFVAEEPSSVDLLILCDVMHHLSPEAHRPLLACASKAIKPGGYLVLKDWERDTSPIHLITYLLDRIGSGDHVLYATADKYRELINDVFGQNCIKNEARIRPRKNNFVFLVQRQII